MTGSLSLSRKTYLSDKKLDTFFKDLNQFKIESENVLKEYGFLTVVVPDKKKSIHQILDNVFIKFHRVAKKLEDRYNDRNYVEVIDEYDVQDILHALLLQYFRDVRPEEYTPSYAGSSTRIDFLLKQERTVIEVKKTRKTMNDKSLGAELIIDRDHYRKHPDCSLLYCFVYDPDEILKNPEGIEDDLSENIDGFDTIVYIVPKRW